MPIRRLLEAFSAAICIRWHAQPTMEMWGFYDLMNAATPFFNPCMTEALSAEKLTQLPHGIFLLCSSWSMRLYIPSPVDSLHSTIFRSTTTIFSNTGIIHTNNQRIKLDIIHVCATIGCNAEWGTKHKVTDDLFII